MISIFFLNILSMLSIEFDNFEKNIILKVFYGIR